MKGSIKQAKYSANRIKYIGSAAEPVGMLLGDILFKAEMCSNAYWFWFLC